VTAFRALGVYPRTNQYAEDEKSLSSLNYAVVEPDKNSEALKIIWTACSRETLFKLEFSTTHLKKVLELPGGA